MTLDSLVRIDEHDVADLGIILEHLQDEELLSYWAFVASYAERDDRKDQLCKQEYLRRKEARETSQG